MSADTTPVGPAGGSTALGYFGAFHCGRCHKLAPQTGKVRRRWLGVSRWIGACCAPKMAKRVSP